MQDQPSAASAPRPQASSVADEYGRAWRRVWTNLMAENVGAIARPPTWEESALRSMLSDLATARNEQLDYYAQTIAAHGTGLGEQICDHLDRLGRVAAEMASVLTILHWAWIKDERLVKIGAGIFDRLEADGE